MRQGTFRAFGYEDMLASNPANFIPILGLVQAIVFSAPFAFLQINVTGALLVYSFYASWGLAGASAVALFAIRTRRVPPALLDVSFVDRRSEGGRLELSYSLGNGKTRRKSLAVEKVLALPDKPMTRVRYKYDLPVEGTHSSIQVALEKPKLVLEFGFPDHEDMNRVYELLK